jgi:hypothetical protein
VYSPPDLNIKERNREEAIDCRKKGSGPSQLMESFLGENRVINLRIVAVGDREKMVNGVEPYRASRDFQARRIADVVTSTQQLVFGCSTKFASLLLEQ